MTKHLLRILAWNACNFEFATQKISSRPLFEYVGITVLHQKVEKSDFGETPTVQGVQKRARGEREESIGDKNTDKTQINLNQKSLVSPKIYFKLEPVDEILHSGTVPIKKALCLSCVKNGLEPEYRPSRCQW